MTTYYLVSGYSALHRAYYTRIIGSLSALDTTKYEYVIMQDGYIMAVVHAQMSHNSTHRTFSLDAK